MKKELVAFMMGALVLSAAEPGLLLHTSFDKYSTIPDFAKNPKTQTKGIRPELQLRMYNGPKGKRNAVLLNNKECVEYTHTDNINLKQGTISFWVKPVNWKMGTTGKFQTFFELRSGDTQNRIIINKDMAGDLLRFSIGSGGKKNTVMLAKTGWLTGEWHKIDCTWNSNGPKPDRLRKRFSRRILTFRNPSAGLPCGSTFSAGGKSIPNGRQLMMS